MENKLLRDFLQFQEGSESKGKVCGDLPPQERVPHTGYVQILFGVQKRVLQLCKRMNQPERMLPLPKRFDSSKANAFTLTVIGECGNG